MPALTALPIASPILVPKLVNVELILFHKPLKKVPQSANTPFTDVQALENFSLNQPATPPKIPINLSHTFVLNQDATESQAVVTPSTANLNAALIAVETYDTKP